MAEAVGIIHVLVSGKTTKHRLTELSNQRMATIPASPVIGQNRTSKFCQAEGIIQFTEGKQSGIGGDLGAVEFQLQAAVKFDPNIARFRFTRRFVHFCPENHRHLH